MRNIYFIHTTWFKFNNFYGRCKVLLIFQRNWRWLCYKEIRYIQIVVIIRFSVKKTLKCNINDIKSY